MNKYTYRWERLDWRYPSLADTWGPVAMITISVSVDISELEVKDKEVCTQYARFPVYIEAGEAPTVQVLNAIQNFAESKGITIELTYLNIYNEALAKKERSEKVHDYNWYDTEWF